MPVKKLAQYLLERFVGKFVDEERPIDLSQGIFESDRVILKDLNLNCKVLNRALEGKTSLRFIKCRIGELSLNFSLVNLKVGLNNLDIVLMPIEQSNINFLSQQVIASQNEQKYTFTQEPYRADSREKELQLVNKLITSVLQGLEAQVTNVAVRVLMREQLANDDTTIPTLLFRVSKLEFKRNGQVKEVPGQQNDLMSLLNLKAVSVGDVSLHLMKDKWLDTNEYLKPNTFNVHLQELKFPYDYPILNHPSTIALLKGSTGQSLTIDFQFNTETQVDFAVKVSNFEIKTNITQLGQLVTFINAIQAVPQRTKAEGKRVVEEVKFDLNISQEQIRDDFVQRMKEDSELMKSMGQMFTLQSDNKNVLMDSAYPANSVSLVVKGKVEVAFVSVQLICNDVEEDRRFKSFNLQDMNRAPNSSELFYDLQLPNIAIDFRQQTDNLVLVINTPQIKLLRYETTPMVAQQSPVQQHMLDDSTQYKSFVSNNNSILFTTCEGIEIQEDYMVQDVFQPIDLAPASPKTIETIITVLEVQNLSLKVKNGVQVSIAKVFAKITSTELLVLMHIKRKGFDNLKESYNGDKQVDNKPLDLKIDVGGLEFEMSLHQVASYEQIKLGNLPGKFQNSGSSIVCNLIKVKVRQRHNQTVPILAIGQLDVVAKSSKKIQITLAQLEGITLKKNANKKLVAIEEEEEIEPVLFVRSNSSQNPDVTQVKKELTHFNLDQVTGYCTAIQFSRLTCDLDSKDFDPLSKFIVQQEIALKHTFNIFDLNQIQQKKQNPTKQPTTWLTFQVQDAFFNILVGSASSLKASRKVLRLRIYQFLFDLRMQNQITPIETSCFSIILSLNQFLLRDLFTPQAEIYVPQKKTDVLFKINESMMIRKPKDTAMFEDELLSSAQTLLVHSSSESKKNIIVKIKLAFVNPFNTGLGERINVDQITSDDTLQVYCDFAECKRNTVQVQVKASLNNLSIQVTNMTMDLIELLKSKWIAKITKLVQKIRSQVQIKPQVKASIDESQEQNYFSVQLYNVQAFYTPALRRDQIEQFLEIPDELKMGFEPLDQVYKTQYLVCLSFGDITLTTDTTRSHHLECSRVGVLFMKEPDTNRLQSWIHYGSDTLSLKGFVQILSLTDLSTAIEDSKVSAKIQSASVQMCSDTLAELSLFSNLAQMAAIRDVESIELIIEQSVGKSSRESVAMKFDDGQLLIEVNNLHPFVAENQEKVFVMNVDGKKNQVLHNYRFDPTQNIDRNYFGNKSGKMIEQRKRIHEICDEFAGLDFSIQIQVAVKCFKLTLFQGKDLDFADYQMKRTEQSSELGASLNNFQPNKSDQKASFINTKIDIRYMEDRDQINRSDIFYDLKTHTRLRKTSRDQKRFLRLIFTDFAVTRRQFPLEQQKRKIKTFALSLGAIQIQETVSKIASEIIEIPYSYRHHNLVELQIISDKSYTTNIEELQIKVALTPLKLQISQHPIDFLLTFVPMKKNLPQQPSVAKQDPANKFLVKSLIIKETTLTISLSAVYSRLVSFENLSIPLKQYSLKQALPVPILVAIEDIAAFYKSDLMQGYRLFSVLGSFKPVQMLSNSFYSIFGLIYKPILGVKDGSVGVAQGLSEGIEVFCGYVGEESYGWGIYLLQKIQNY